MKVVFQHNNGSVNGFSNIDGVSDPEKMASDISLMLSNDPYVASVVCAREAPKPRVSIEPSEGGGDPGIWITYDAWKIDDRFSFDDTDMAIGKALMAQINPDMVNIAPLHDDPKPPSFIARCIKRTRS